MTTATGRILVIRETEEGFELELDGDTYDIFETRQEAEEARDDLASQDQEQDDEERRVGLREQIAELLENVSRIDSLEGLLKSVRRLQD